MDRTARLPRDPACRQLADALWDGVRHTPPLPPAGDGLRGWYLGGPYATVVERRRQRVWQHRRTEPWLTTQWLLERARTPARTCGTKGCPGSTPTRRRTGPSARGSSSARSCSSPGSAGREPPRCRTSSSPRSPTSSPGPLVGSRSPASAVVVPQAQRLGHPPGGGHGGRPRDLVHPAVRRQCGLPRALRGADRSGRRHGRVGPRAGRTLGALWRTWPARRAWW